MIRQTENYNNGTTARATTLKIITMIIDTLEIIKTNENK